MPDLTIRLAATGKSLVGSESDQHYGEIAFSYGGRTDMSRSTSPREILPLIYKLAGLPLPAPTPGDEYPGYPLVANAEPSLIWFLAVLPLSIALAWHRSRRAPPIPAHFQQAAFQQGDAP